MCTPEWRPIPGYSGYEASSQGHIRSWIAWRSTPVPRLRRPVLHKGYYSLRLRNDGGEIETRAVHILVALAFFGPRPSGMDVCHNDGDSTNNAAANLRYDTRTANIRDMQKHGTANYLAGEVKQGAKLSESDVREIRRLYASGGHTHRSLAAQYGVSHCVVGKVIRGTDWREVS
jgi:hypothetical protein